MVTQDPFLLMPIWYPANGVYLKASTVGGSSEKMVFRTASDWQVAMGNTNRAGCSHAFNDANIHRDWAHIPTIATINEQSSGSGAGNYT